MAIAELIYILSAIICSARLKKCWADESKLWIYEANVMSYTNWWNPWLLQKVETIYFSHETANSNEYILTKKFSTMKSVKIFISRHDKNRVLFVPGLWDICKLVGTVDFFLSHHSVVLWCVYKSSSASRFPCYYHKVVELTTS